MDNSEFRFTYSAKEQEEIKNIRSKYEPKEESKMERLRRLDKSVTDKANVCSLFVGIIGALIMGAGMSLCMTDIGDILGIAYSLPFGVIIGIVGIATMLCAYPIYSYTVKKERQKAAPEILRLTDELMK